MSALAWLAGALLTLGLAAIGGIVSDEARARLERIPYRLLSAAIRRLPHEVRADVSEEWRAELDHILHRVHTYPLTRLLLGTRFALGLLRAAPAIGKSLIGVRGSGEEQEPRKSAAQRSAALLAAITRPRTARSRTWRNRLVVTPIAGVIAFILINWEIGVSAAVIAALAHTIRSRTVSARPPGLCAQTARLLPHLRRDQYTCLHSLAIPGTGEIIEHLIIGPGGIHILVPQRWDRRLPARVDPVVGQLYRGPASQAAVLEAARRQAAAAAELISTGLGTTIQIKPGVLILGPRLFRNAVPATDAIQLHGVDIFGPGAARRWLERTHGTIPPERETLTELARHILAKEPAPIIPSEATPSITS